MRALTEVELTRMQGAQEDAMMDQCSILTYSSTVVSGEVQDGWTESGNRVKCGLNTQKSREIHKDDLTIVKTDAQLRLPIGTTVAARDRIKVITRFGQPEAELLTYGIAGEPQQGPSGLVLDLVIINPGVNR